jgi:glutamate racemase
MTAEKYLLDLRRLGVDTAVLGCTHYPLLARIIAEVLGPRVEIVDSAEATADAVESLLERHDLLRRGRDAARHRTLCTDVPDRFRAVAERFLGRPVDDVELVDLTP